MTRLLRASIPPEVDASLVSRIAAVARESAATAPRRAAPPAVRLRVAGIVAAVAASTLGVAVAGDQVLGPDGDPAPVDTPPTQGPVDTPPPVPGSPAPDDERAGEDVDATTSRRERPDDDATRDDGEDGARTSTVAPPTSAGAEGPGDRGEPADGPRDARDQPARPDPRDETPDDPRDDPGDGGEDEPEDDEEAEDDEVEPDDDREEQVGPEESDDDADAADGEG